jgi:hypothetical protein
VPLSGTNPLSSTRPPRGSVAAIRREAMDGGVDRPSIQVPVDGGLSATNGQPRIVA